MPKQLNGQSGRGEERNWSVQAVVLGAKNGDERYGCVSADEAKEVDRLVCIWPPIPKKVPSIWISRWTMGVYFSGFVIRFPRTSGVSSGITRLQSSEGSMSAIYEAASWCTSR